jgi:hypothetical protein
VISIVQALAPFSAILAAVILRTDRRIVGGLRERGALSPEHAVDLPPRNPVMRWRLERLIGRGAVARTDSGSVYLDESGWQAFRSWRRRRALTVIAIMLPIVFLLFYLARAGKA